MNFRIILFIVFIGELLMIQPTLSFGQTKPGNHTLNVGDMKIDKLQDAQIYLNLSLLSGIEHNEALMQTDGQDSVKTPVNAFLILTPKHKILVDTGIGKYPGQDSGHLLDGLKNAGVSPESIDLILITHFHFDHIGGLTSSEGKRIFPNAIVRASKTESDFWMRDSSEIPSTLRERAKSIKTLLQPYLDAKSFIPFSPNEDLGDGIKAISANGHTPGHTIYSFSSKGNEFWCIGDLIHFGAIQFKNPSAYVTFDSNSKTAIDSRISLFSLAAKKHITLAGAHLPEMVQLKREGDSFVAKIVNNH